MDDSPVDVNLTMRIIVGELDDFASIPVGQVHVSSDYWNQRGQKTKQKVYGGLQNS